MIAPKRLMIDIETLSTRNDAAVIAIGASVSRFGKIEKTQGMYIDPRLAIGHRSIETLEFWADQPPDVRAKVWGGINNVEKALTWLDDLYRQYKPDEVWANSPQFDLVILRYAYRAVGRDAPWHFTGERDFRTLKNLARMKGIDYQKAYEGIIKHDPESDAECQLKAVDLILEKLI